MIFLVAYGENQNNSEFSDYSVVSYNSGFSVHSVVLFDSCGFGKLVFDYYRQDCHVGGRCAQNLTKSLRKSFMICVIFNHIYFDFERSDPFYKNADVSFQIIKQIRPRTLALAWFVL